MTQTKKFSQFNGPDPIQNGDIVVGLRVGGDGVLDNWQFTGVGSGGGGGDITIIINQDTSQLQPGRWVRIDNTGLYVHALANTPENAEIVGCVKNILNANQFTLQVVGYIPAGTVGFSGFIPGRVYFLSDTIPGGITLIEPTTNGEVSLPCFIAETANSGWVRQSRGVIIAGVGPIPPGGGGGDDNTEHTVNQPGHPFQVGDWVRVFADTFYVYADGTTLQNSQAIGVVKSVNGPLFTVQQSGYSTNAVTQDDAGNPLIAGTVYYLSTTVPGQISATEPTLYGQSSKPVFISESPINLAGWIFPQRPRTVTGEDPNIIFITQIGHGFIRGDVVRISASNTYVKAQANNFTNSLAVGFVVYVPNADQFVLQTAGYCSQFFAPFAPLVPAAQYYLSETVAGAVTTIEPANPNWSKPMLAALNPTTGYILEQRPIQASGGGGAGGIIQTVYQAIERTIFSTTAFNLNQPYELSGGTPTFSLTITPTNANNWLRIGGSFFANGTQGMWRTDLPSQAVAVFAATNFTTAAPFTPANFTQYLYLPALNNIPITFRLRIFGTLAQPARLNNPLSSLNQSRYSVLSIDEIPPPNSIG